MKYLSINNLEKYHPGYKDRNLIWCKLYFSMINGDPEFEMLEEIDQLRFIKFIMLEIQSRKPIPLDEQYLIRKGFDLKKRSIMLTIDMLHNFISVVTEDSKTPYPRVEKSRVEKSNVTHLFVVPTIDEIREYCQERNNTVSAEKFHSYYSSNGWLVGKNKMKDWKASVRTWEFSRKEFGNDKTELLEGFR